MGRRRTLTTRVDSTPTRPTALAQWNNEGHVVNETHKNFVSPDKYVMIKAEKDTMTVLPGRHRGHFKDGSLKVLLMNETNGTPSTLGLRRRPGPFQRDARHYMQFSKEHVVGWLGARAF